MHAGSARADHVTERTGPMTTLREATIRLFDSYISVEALQTCQAT
jgi:hypothetical protein